MLMENQFLLIFNNVNKMLNILEKYSVVHVFFDESISDEQRQILIKEINKKTQTITTVIAPCYAEQKLADSLTYRKEDFVVAVGKLHIQSLVKYYAYANNINYAIVPVHEVAEYSFCKYAYLKDDKFCFYLCSKPVFAFVKEDFFTKNDIAILRKILSYKNIVLYEKETEGILLEQHKHNIKNIVDNINCCKFEWREVIKLYCAISLKLEKTNTSNILGNEYVVLSLLATNKKDISINLISATNLLAKFYECLNKFDLIRIEPNINVHIYKLKQHYKFNIYQIKDTILSRFGNVELSKIEYRANAYGPYLKQLFNTQKNHFIYSKLTFTSKELELALALGPALCTQNNLLTIAREFGYFENLLK